MTLSELQAETGRSTTAEKIAETNASLHSSFRAH